MVAFLGALRRFDTDGTGVSGYNVSDRQRFDTDGTESQDAVPSQMESRQAQEPVVKHLPELLTPAVEFHEPRWGRNNGVTRRHACLLP